MPLAPTAGFATFARRAALVLACGAASHGVGCDESTESIASRAVPTAVVVDPSLFLGDLPCADISGAPRSYRATLVDLDGGQELGPSPRASCAAPVYFNNFAIDHRYMARVEVFDVPADVEGASPFWQTTCAEDGDGAAVPVLNKHVVVGGCTPLSGPGSAITAVVVDPTAAASSLGCADGGPVGDITVVPVSPAGSGLPTVTLGCGQPGVSYGAGVLPGTQYTFRLDADGPLGPASFGTTCSVRARAGLGMPATCLPFTDRGDLVFPIEQLLSDSMFACGDPVTRATVALTAGASTFPAKVVPCDREASVGALPAGPYVGAVNLFGGPSVLASFACTGTVVPAERTELVCVLED